MPIHLLLLRHLVTFVPDNNADSLNHPPPLLSSGWREHTIPLIDL